MRVSPGTRSSNFETSKRTVSERRKRGAQRGREGERGREERGMYTSVLEALGTVHSPYPE